MTEYDEYYEEENQAPAPKRRRVVAPKQELPATEDAPEAAAEDEAPAPAPAKKAAAKKATPPTGANGIRGGWSAGQQVMESGSQYAQNLKLDSNEQVIKFLDDSPYASYQRHWVERKGSLRPYVCLQSVGKECPLCNLGERPQATSAFNVAVVGDDGGVLLKTWDVGPRIFNTLKNFANNSKGGGLSYGFYTVSKIGQKQQSQTLITPVRDSLLSEVTGIEPPSSSALEALGKYDADIITVPSPKEMAELAAELSSGDDY
jgi:hypothetical protein